MKNYTSYCNVEADQLLLDLETSIKGLSQSTAEERLKLFGSKLNPQNLFWKSFLLLIGQFKSPIMLILIFAAVLSFFLGDPTNAIIILIILAISGLLSFWQENGANNAMEKLISIVEVKTTVIRDGQDLEISADKVVPGDIFVASSGSLIPGDALLLESNDLFVDEASMTGETFPVEKLPGVLPVDTPLNLRNNSLFMGTHVVSGTAKAVIVHTGKTSEFGKVSQRLNLNPPETDFAKGIRQFGFFLMQITLLLTIAIFAINVLLHKPVLDSFLFSLALAIGMTPQLLPAIISINLAHGAKRMATNKVIVKRLSSIVNLGSMNILCSDKTGTLTEGKVQLHSALGINGLNDQQVLRFAYFNALFETGFANPIDEAIKTAGSCDVSGVERLDEVPYDFIRKRLSILLRFSEKNLLVSKGALQNILEVCHNAQDEKGDLLELNKVLKSIEESYLSFSEQGLRVLGIAIKDLEESNKCSKTDETQMTFLGFLLFFDPPKSGAIETIAALKNLGISLKIITGDNELVAAHVSKQVGIKEPKVLTGKAIREMSDQALVIQADRADVFAAVEPNQKERLILALKKGGHVVGYIGDGINDASALHAADVGISVEGGVDVAKEAADIILLEKELDVLVNGVKEGRITFANTMKYIFMATSSNFGNMFSMAAASLILPFLPLLPKQILLLNLATDFPEIAIATDNVDEDWISKPIRWDIGFIRRFMIVFGSISSFFDFMTFGVLLVAFHANESFFQTGWFFESIISASVIVLVIRSRKPFFRSKPGRQLLIATTVVLAAIHVFLFTPLAKVFEFMPLPLAYLLVAWAIVLFYVLVVENVKRWFYRKLTVVP